MVLLYTNSVEMKINKKVSVVLMTILTLTVIIVATYPIIFSKFQDQDQEIPTSNVIESVRGEALITYSGHIEISDSGSFPNSFILAIDSVEISIRSTDIDEELSNIDKICASPIFWSLDVRSNTNLYNWTWLIFAHYGEDVWNDFACLPYNDGNISGNFQINKLNRIEVGTHPYFYYGFPFDQVEMTIDLNTSIAYFDSDGNKIKEIEGPASLRISPAKNVLGKYYITDINNFRDSDTAFDIKFNRPP